MSESKPNNTMQGRRVILEWINLSFYAVTGAVVQEVLEGLDYEVEVKEGPHAELYPALGRSEVDLLAATWLPNAHGAIGNGTDGIPSSSPPFTGAAGFYWAVPDYVPEDAVGSVEDLTRPEVAEKILPDKNAEIIVYCMNTGCEASVEEARELTGMGYRNVRHYVEGKQAWIRAGLPVEGHHASAGRSRAQEGVPSWRRSHARS